MKNYLISMAFALALGMAIPASGQVQNGVNKTSVTAPDTTTASGGIDAFSDTTSVDTTTAGTGGHSIVVDDDDRDMSDWHDINSLKDLMSALGIGIGGSVVAVLVLFVLLLIALTPFILIGVVVYLIVRNNNNKYKMAQEAMSNGQPIPDGLINNESQTDDYLWRKGVKNIFLGIGLAICFNVMGAEGLAGIGWLVCLCGVGQAVIAKTSKKKNADDLNAPEENKDENQLNK